MQDIQKCSQKTKLDAFFRIVFFMAVYLCGYIYVVRCAIQYHLYNFKNVKNTHGRVLLSKNNTFPQVFFTFFELYKWYKVTQRISYASSNLFIDLYQSLKLYQSSREQHSLFIRKNLVANMKKNQEYSLIFFKRSSLVNRTGRCIYTHINDSRVWHVYFDCYQPHLTMPVVPFAHIQ